jgi:hypothetical protein
MALVLKDRVKVTSTTTGTGTLTLGSASTGFQDFSVIGNGNTTYYTIAAQSGGEWEVGLGTVSDSGGTWFLARSTVYESSNSNAAVNFSAGTKDVFVTYPSEASVNLNAAGNVSALGTVSSGTWQGTAVGVAYGGTGQTTQQAAINALVGTQTANRVLRSDGTNMSLSQVALATDVSGTLPVANGGTGQTSYTNGQILIGNTTGNTLTKTTLTAGSGISITNGAGSITIASTASTPCATPTTAGKVYGKTVVAGSGGQTSLGISAGATSQSCCAVAIGKSAGQYGQGSSAVAIGACAGSFVPCSVAQSCNSVAIGKGAVATGAASGAIVIGYQAYSFGHANSFVVGVNTGATGACQTHIGPIRSFGSMTCGLQGLFYNACTREVISGTAGGGGASCATPATPGVVYGSTNTYQTAIGQAAGQYTPGLNSVAVGAYAGSACQGGQSVAIGSSAAICGQGACAVAIGYYAHPYFQPSSSIAIGQGTYASGSYQTHIGPIRNNPCAPYALRYCPCTREITYG